MNLLIFLFMCGVGFLMFWMIWILITICDLLRDIRKRLDAVQVEIER